MVRCKTRYNSMRGRRACGIDLARTAFDIAWAVMWLRPIDKLSNFALVFSSCTRSRTTALHTAASTGKLEVVDLLLARGAPINSTANPKGMTPLHLAASGGHADIVALLLEKGAELNITDKRGRTALALAAKLHRKAVLPLLNVAGYEANVPAGPQPVPQESAKPSSVGFISYSNWPADAPRFLTHATQFMKVATPKAPEVEVEAESFFGQLSRRLMGASSSSTANSLADPARELQAGGKSVEC